MYKVLISVQQLQMDIDMFKDIFHDNDIKIDLPKADERLEEDELLEIIDKYDGVICGDDKFTKKVLAKAKKLKVIVKWGTGIDSIDTIHAKKLNIPVFNTPNAFSEPVADTVMGFILSFARNILDLNTLMKNGKWQKIKSDSLSGKTLGIIGVGNIGRAVAKRAIAFGMNVLGNDIKEIPKEITKKYAITMVGKDKLLKESDYVSLSCDLNETSHHLIDKDALQMMKNSAFVINTARGPVINEQNLIEALQKKQIAGAGLDVFEEEPLPQKSPLRTMENVLLSPHCANSCSHHWYKVHQNSINNLLEGLSVKRKH